MSKPKTAQELRDTPAIIPLCDKTTIGKDFKVDDPEWHTPGRVNTYIIDRIEGYETIGAIDWILWETFQEDFEGWNKALFEIAHRTVRNALKANLRSNGVCVYGAKYVSEQLCNVLKEDEYQNWPTEEVGKQINSGQPFNSYENPKYQAQMKATTYTPQGHTAKPTPPGQTPPPIQTPLPALNPLTKTLTDLAKLYNNNELKFGGDMYDVLDAKLKIFYEKCLHANVNPFNYHHAFSTMLKGKAQQFYFDRLAGQNLEFDEMIRRTREHFHTTENLQLCLEEWRSTTLINMIEKNPNNTLPENLELVIDKLQKVQKGLSAEHQTDESLRNQLISACQGISACKVVLIKPPATYEGTIAELRNAVGVETRCRAQTSSQYYTRGNQGYSYWDEYSDDDASDQFWVDRRYQGGRNPSRGGRYPRGNYGQKGNRGKRCFVCKKPGCWSTRHPPSERRAHRDKWRQYAQEKGKGSSPSDFEMFLMNFEGMDLDTWNDDYGNSWDDEHGSEHHPTSLGVG